jgi:hypothetical protein
MGKGLGVKELTVPLKVILPLLLMKNLSYEVPKKFTPLSKASDSNASNTIAPDEPSSLPFIAKLPNPLSVEPSQPERSTEALAVVLEIENASAALANRDNEKREDFFMYTSL